MSLSPILLQDIQEQATQSTAYDSIWAGGNVPTQSPTALEQVMLAHDKLYVVLAVVLIIWFGIVILLLRNDARLKVVERSIEERGTLPDDGL